MQEVDKIRNIALIGHSSSGKTMLAEAMLFKSGMTSRFGKVGEGNTVSDYTPDEVERGISITTSVLHIKSGEHLINLLDTPGYTDFIGELLASLRAVDAVVLTISASAGVEVGTERNFGLARERNLPVVFFVSKCDKENTGFQKILDEIEKSFGPNCIPFALPQGMGENLEAVWSIFERENAPEEIRPRLEEYYQKVVDFAAEADDSILERYLEGGELTSQELLSGLQKAIKEGRLFPVYFGAAEKEQIGIDLLIKGIIDLAPSPTQIGSLQGKGQNNQQEMEREPDLAQPFSAFVFKTIYDPYVGQLTIFRVFSGKLDADSGFYNSTKKVKERVGQIFKLQGKEQIPIPSALTGEIVAVAKLKETKTSDTLSDEKNPIVYPAIEYPESPMCLSIKPKSREDEEKIMEALHRLGDEDPTFRVSRESQTKELLISGLGDLHLEVMVGRLKARFGVDVDLGMPKVPYKETITKKAQAQGKYKRQTGGRGQYGDVWLEIEPLPRGAGFEFVDKIVGGVVPKQYIPAVEKGVRQAMQEGILAGYPVVDTRVTLYDGSYHSVDSSDLAFQIAASMGFKKAAQSAGLVLLEPIMDVEITIPDEYMGQISGDISSRRGRILGMEAKGGMQAIKAQVPLAEMFKYASELRSMTAGRGYYTMRFSHYEIVPQKIAEKVIQNAQQVKAESR